MGLLEWTPSITVDSELSSFYHLQHAHNIWKNDWLVGPFKKQLFPQTKFEKRYILNVTKWLVGLCQKETTISRVFDKLQWLWTQTISTNTVWRRYIEGTKWLVSWLVLVKKRYLFSLFLTDCNATWYAI